MIKKTVALLSMFIVLTVSGQESVARKWNEVLLEAIRNDFARPTVHARNLFHISAGMYDAWTVYDEVADPFFLGHSDKHVACEFNDFSPNEDIEISREKTISYVAYRLIKHRFLFSPGVVDTYNLADSLLEALGHDPSITSTDYSDGSAAALGNYLAECIIQYGLNDGSNEENGYENTHYKPINEPLVVSDAGNPTISNPDRWQPLSLDTFIDQSGNEIPGSTPDFLSPEWGDVKAFSLNDDQFNSYTREGEYKVYLDPGSPPFLSNNETSEYYKWGFSLVSIWGSHLDPTDNVIWDISPVAIGNLQELPESYLDYSTFYGYTTGGDNSSGRTVNPVTNEPYNVQLVPRGDYARVLAEFWADGPDSETPPGHWFTILNYVSDHPLLEKRIDGEGKIVSDLEWDIKSYFILGGTMHDVAIASWGIKGWYDYVRPVSAIRYMADQGQSSDSNLPNYNTHGIPLVDGYIELVLAGDPLEGPSGENIGKIKLFTWKGPDYINDPEVDHAGVDWILAENWWPYQRPSFVTPPFAGFVSGHSTYSQAAARALTLLTGSEYFPGGLGEFIAPQNEFLVFEEGPSVDVVLQWATYKDAADQCSLSRIWGGIHPPADDIPGRKIGLIIGDQAYEYSSKFFSGVVTSITERDRPIIIYPNPANNSLRIDNVDRTKSIVIRDVHGKVVKNCLADSENNIDIEDLKTGVYLLQVIRKGKNQYFRFYKN